MEEIMGAFYYPIQEPSFPYIYYASVNNDLRDAIKAAELLRGSCQEIYLVDPLFSKHLEEAYIKRSEIPHYLRVIVSERTSARIPYQNSSEVKRTYLYFNQAGYAPLSNAVILISLQDILTLIQNGVVERGTLRVPVTVQIYA